MKKVTNTRMMRYRIWAFVSVLASCQACNESMVLQRSVPANLQEYADFEQAPPENIVKMNPFSAGEDFRVKCGEGCMRLKRDEVFGFSCAGGRYRIWKNYVYEILCWSPDFQLYRTRQLPSRANPEQEYVHYYFSPGHWGDIHPLNGYELKRCYASRAGFLENLSLHTRSESDWVEFLPLYGKYRIQWLMEMSASELKQDKSEK